jgi:hypothetical protein
MEIEIKQCKKCQQNFELDQDDFSFYEKMKVPVPNICPDCRFKMKAMWRNEMRLYSGRKCDLCNKNILSMYNPKSLYKVYCYDCFYSDKWQAVDYGVDYNLSEPFFSQVNILFKKVPRINLGISSGDGPNINSEYVNMAGGCKNCYLVFNGGIGEEMMYCRGVRHGLQVSDCYFGENLERCYECINSLKSNGLIFARNTFDSMDSIFVLNCRNINDCFGCVNLQNKSNYFFNQALSKEEYTKKVKEIIGSYSKMEEYKKRFFEFSLQFAKRENNNFKTSNSVGDFLLECKNIKNSFEIIGAENSKNLFSTRSAHNSNGVIGYGFKSELLLECVSTGLSLNIIGSFSVGTSQNIYYSFNLKNCHDCISCDGLKNAQHCILNKQYSKEEYEKLKEHIVKELTDLGIHGLMMPPEIAPFAYNETIAQDNMPLTKEEALAQGFRWEDDVQMTIGKETLKPENIPNHINDVDDSIIKEILKCIECERNYKITEQELRFYRKMILPIPRKCFFCRHRNRIQRRGPFKFFKRNCDNCGKETHTNLTKEVAPTMYCEKCYQQEVI